MSDENEPQKLTRREKGIALIMVGTLAVIFAPYLLTRSSCFPSFADDRSSAIGDTIGGITAPIVGLLGAILVFYALLEQIKANDIITDQFKEQKKITYRQNFEQTFFNMLNMHREIVNNMSLVPSEISWELHFSDDTKNKIEKDSIDKLLVVMHKLENSTSDENEKSYEHRAFFKFSSGKLIELIYLSDKYGGMGKGVKKTKFEIPNSTDSFESYFPHIYYYMFHKLDTHLGHYYRNLYRIVKMIDEQIFSDDEKEDYDIKYFYASIVRSQLSDYEIKWLFFNGLYDYGKEFKPLIEEYSMLKILNRNPDITIIKFKSQYRASAFEEVKWDFVIDEKTGKEINKRKKGYERSNLLKIRS